MLRRELIELKLGLIGRNRPFPSSKTGPARSGSRFKGC
jgi:hypothetical protein